MSLRLFPLALAAAALLAGCATFSKDEVARLRRGGVGDEAIVRLQDITPLEPAEVAALTRDRVPPVALRQHLTRNGIDYLPHTGDVKAMRQGGVSPGVIETLLRESDSFARRRQRAELTPGWGVGWWASDPWLWGWESDLYCW